jgi:cytochrome P450 family 628
MIRKKENHVRRRKTWDRGFSAKGILHEFICIMSKLTDQLAALRGYEPKVSAYADLLISQIDARLGQPMNMTDWFNFYSFDVMGDLAFGKSFNMLRDGVKHYFMKTLHADMVNVGILSHLPWLFPIFKAIPVLNAENKRFWEFVTGLVEERIQV